ncbi:Isy1-like splicing family protein, partial [Kipferlia bialata]|eukprot:g12741.t1
MAPVKKKFQLDLSTPEEFVQEVTCPGLVIMEAQEQRQELVREIGIAVDHIHNENLDEARVRELNDFINGLLRSKRRWEYRIQ